MNHTKAACGHHVPAVGAPGSEAREKCEKNPCDQCRIVIDRLACEYTKAVANNPKAVIYVNIAKAYIATMKQKACHESL